jgi:ABC-type transporter Mla subunit MlaD
MMRTGSWWQRFRDVWGRSVPADQAGEQLPKVGDDGLLSDPVATADADLEAAPDRVPGPLSRWSKRDQTLAKLQEGYEQVTRVIQDIQTHLITQADRSERICTSLEQLARSANDLPTISREQAQTLEHIAANLEATGTRTQQMTEAISEVPKLAKAQGEALVGISRQLEIAGEQRVMTSQTLDRIGTAIGTLNTASQNQGERLKMIGTRADQQVELLTQMIARQNRRFIMLFVVTVILALAAIGGAVSFLVLSTHG